MDITAQRTDSRLAPIDARAAHDQDLSPSSRCRALYQVLVLRYATSIRPEATARRAFEVEGEKRTMLDATKSNEQHGIALLLLLVGASESPIHHSASPSSNTNTPTARHSDCSSLLGYSAPSTGIGGLESVPVLDAHNFYGMFDLIIDDSTTTPATPRVL